MNIAICDDEQQDIDILRDFHMFPRIQVKLFPEGVYEHAQDLSRRGAQQEYGRCFPFSEYSAGLHQSGLYGFSIH